MSKGKASPRQRRILNLLAVKPEVSVSEFAKEFQVSTMTIRRDLEALEQQKQITRTHGGAILAAPSFVAFAFQDRRRSRMAEKEAIAEEAIKQLNHGMTIIIDTGTTTLEVARALAGIFGLKILTSSLAIASELFTCEGIELTLLGGTVNRESPDLSGQLTQDNLSAFRADIAFVGADALDGQGLYTSSQQIAGVSKAMIASAAKTVLVADSSKFTKTSFVRFAEWKQVDMVITDKAIEATHKRRLKKAVSEVVFV
jgi:DeoR family transcriptional regulator, fructose operon transcriptional repressor